MADQTAMHSSTDVEGLIDIMRSAARGPEAEELAREDAARILAALADAGRLLPPHLASSTIRWCSYLGCTASYDAIGVVEGKSSAAGWRRWPSLNSAMCPDHAYLWGTGDTIGPHHPGLEARDGGPAITCTCGWQRGTHGITAGKAAETYFAHLLYEDVRTRFAPLTTNHPA